MGALAQVYPYVVYSPANLEQESYEKSMFVETFETEKDLLE